MSSIPTRSRELVRKRENFHCLRCGGRGAEWSHRVRRGVRGEHRHCPCNGAYLCTTCHRFITLHPATGIAEGFILSAFNPEPYSYPVSAWFGQVYLTCEGDYERTADGSDEGRPASGSDTPGASAQP